MKNAKLVLPAVMPDEYLLGAMIAEAKARGLRACTHGYFQDADGRNLGFIPEEGATVAACCAAGAVALVVGGQYLAMMKAIPGKSLCGLVPGNDDRQFWTGPGKHDAAESIGNAFYEAMQ